MLLDRYNSKCKEEILPRKKEVDLYEKRIIKISLPNEFRS